MPIPPVNATPKEIEELGWLKKVVYEWITVVRGKIMYHKMEYEVGKIGLHGMCTRCKGDDGIYLTTMPSGVYRCCLYCGVTLGPLPSEEDKQPVGSMLEEKQITEREAFKLLMRTNQSVPLGLRPRMRKR